MTIANNFLYTIGHSSILGIFGIIFCTIFGTYEIALHHPTTIVRHLLYLLLHFIKLQLDIVVFIDFGSP